LIDRKVARLINCCIFTSFCPAAQKQEGLYEYEGRELIYHDKPRPGSSDEAGGWPGAQVTVRDAATGACGGGPAQVMAAQGEPGSESSHQRARCPGHGQGRGHGCARWWTGAGDGRARGTGIRVQPQAHGHLTDTRLEWKHWTGGGDCAFRPSGPPPAGGGRRTEHGGAGGTGLELEDGAELDVGPLSAGLKRI
jgi:hypothetical protein